MKVVSKLKKEIKKVNVEYNLTVGFNDTFKSDNSILSIVPKANGMITWMVRNIISREANVILKIYKTLTDMTSYRILYSGLGSSVWRRQNWSVILRLDDLQRSMTKIIKRVKDYSYRERFWKLGSTTFQERRVRSNVIETFKIIGRISNYGRQLFNISPQTGNNCLNRFQKLNL